MKYKIRNKKLDKFEDDIVIMQDGSLCRCKEIIFGRIFYTSRDKMLEKIDDEEMKNFEIIIEL